jgi:hypothetical protein
MRWWLFEIIASLSASIDDVATADVQDDGTLTFTLRDSWLYERVFQFASLRNGTPWVAGSGSNIVSRICSSF